MQDRFRGCLVAGAVGDALGAPVEFVSLEQIRARHGERGVTGYVGGSGEITDDTQMTLFTAEGLIRASVRARSRGICHLPSVVHHAYLRWLHTQGVPWARAGAPYGAAGPDGWLVGERRLHARRGPGMTCLTALDAGRAGTVEEPVNDSKGCGGVMRVAPVGLFFGDAAEAFATGCEVAALTHGHPSGWLAAGALAATISLLVQGGGLVESVARAAGLLMARPRHEETSEALRRAVALAADGNVAPERLESLGGGWVAEEALAIAVCCALAEPVASAALLAAVNHSGDSDSTGAICGNLVGAAYGTAAVPAEWVDGLVMHDLVTQVADDLWRERYEPPADEWGDAPPEWWARYPGW